MANKEKRDLKESIIVLVILPEIPGGKMLVRTTIKVVFWIR